MVCKYKRFGAWVFFALVAASATPALAQNPKSIGSFGNWQALTFEDDGKQGCYVIAEPDRKEGAYSSRGKVYALVTHRPEDKQVDVVTIIAGYTYKDSSEVAVEIGDDKFALFTSEGTAWAPDEESDHNLVEAMKKGSGMIVRGVSSRGTETTDSYSLTGFTRAYNAIGQACGLTR